MTRSTKFFAMKMSVVAQFLAIAATSYAVMGCVGPLWDTMNCAWAHYKVGRDRRQRMRLALEHQAHGGEVEGDDSDSWNSEDWEGSDEVGNDRESGTSEDSSFDLGNYYFDGNGASLSGGRSGRQQDNAVGSTFAPEEVAGDDHRFSLGDETSVEPTFRQAESRVAERMSNHFVFRATPVRWSAIVSLVTRSNERVQSISGSPQGRIYLGAARNFIARENADLLHFHE